MDAGRPFAELIRGLPGTPFGDWQAVRVFGIGTDSRAVAPGDLFVALPGARTHGLLHLDEAVLRGAAALVVPEAAGELPPLPGLRHPRPELALADIAARFFRDPSAELPVVGVTGTNGKTTTALLIAHLLRAAGYDPAAWTTTLVSGWGADFRPLWTTPPAHRLQRFLREAVDAGKTAAVLEVSSHGVALGRIRNVRFRAAVGTNVSPDHLDFHGSFEAYVAAKRAFFAGLDAEAVAVLNADDPVVRTFASATRARVLTYGCAEGGDSRAGLPPARPGREGRADLIAEGVQIEPSAAEFTLAAGPRLAAVAPAADRELPLRVRLPLPGRHNVQNALAALGACLGLGLPADRLASALASFPHPPRRLEPHRVGPCLVVNDVAMNEASYEAVLRTVGEYGASRLVVVNALRGGRGAEVNAAVARVLGLWNRSLRFAPLIVCLSRPELARYPVDHQVRDAELAAFLDAAAAEGLAVSVHAELASAVAEAVARLAPGDLLLLLGTFGMDEGPALAVGMLEDQFGLPRSSPPVYPPQRDF